MLWTVFFTRSKNANSQSTSFSLTRSKQVSAVTRLAFNISALGWSVLSCSNNFGHLSICFAFASPLGWFPCQCACPPVCWQSKPSMMTRSASPKKASDMQPAPEFPYALNLAGFRYVVMYFAGRLFVENLWPTKSRFTSSRCKDHQGSSKANMASAQGAALNVVFATITALFSCGPACSSKRQSLTRSMSPLLRLGPLARTTTVAPRHLPLKGDP